MDENGEIHRSYFCANCRAHNVVQSLKGHGPSCPFRNCYCGICKSAVLEKAKLLDRRFHCQHPNQNQTVLTLVRSKKGLIDLRIIAKTGDDILWSININYVTGPPPFSRHIQIFAATSVWQQLLNAYCHYAKIYTFTHPDKSAFREYVPSEQH